MSHNNYFLIRLNEISHQTNRREIQKLSLEMRLADNGATRVSDVAELEQSYIHHRSCR